MCSLTLQTFISEILKEKIGSRRHRIVKIGLSRLFPRNLHNYQWLVGELVSFSTAKALQNWHCILYVMYAVWNSPS